MAECCLLVMLYVLLSSFSFSCPEFVFSVVGMDFEIFFDMSFMLICNSFS